MDSSPGSDEAANTQLDGRSAYHSHDMESPRGARGGGGDFGSPESDYEYFEAADLMPSDYARPEVSSAQLAPHGVAPSSRAEVDGAARLELDRTADASADHRETTSGPLQGGHGAEMSAVVTGSIGGIAHHDDTVRLIEQDLAHAATALSRRIRNRGGCSRRSRMQQSRVFCVFVSPPCTAHVLLVVPAPNALLVLQTATTTVRMAVPTACQTSQAPASSLAAAALPPPAVAAAARPQLMRSGRQSPALGGAKS